MIGIITDSTCDIPENLLNQNGIEVVPHTIIWGDKQYLDRVDLQPLQFYQQLITNPVRPTTSQATLFDFKRVYEKVIARGGVTELIVLTVSSAMSGAYNMAQNAAKLVNIPVHVIDAKGPTMSLGWQVLAAARAREAGAEIQEILSSVEKVRSRLVQFVCMDTIEYLQKGGRIGDAMRWVGGLMQVKPLVSINHQTGRVEPVSLSRTHRLLVETMYNRFFEKLKDGQNLHITVLHGNVQAKAETLAERIRSEYNPLELLVNITGPVLGINTGPGALALCGYAESIA